MRISKKIKEKGNKKSVESKPSFESENKIERLKLLVIIVNRNQGQFFVSRFLENDISAVFEVYGKGTAPKEIYELVGLNDSKKDLVLGIIKESDLDKYMKIINERFSFSPTSKGVAFTIKISSMAGVIMYKFLTNNKERIKNGK